MGNTPGVPEQEVRQAPVAGVKASGEAPLDAFGGGQETAKAYGVAGDLANTSASVFYERAKQQKELQDLTANYDAAAKLSQLQVGLINQTQATKGQNAEGIYAPTMESYKNGAADIANGLQTPEQKAAFQRQVFSHQVELDRVVQSHQAGERLNTTKQTMAASTAKFEDSAEAKVLVDPAGAEMDLARANSARAEQARVSGLKGDAKDQFMSLGESSARFKVLNAYLSAGADLGAKNYFEANESKFIGEELNTARRLVKNQSSLAEAQRVVDQAFQQQAFDFTQDEKPSREPFSKADVMERVRAATEGMDPKVRDEAEVRASRRWGALMEDRRETTDANFQNSANAIRKAISAQGQPNEAGAASVPVLSPTDVISPSDWDALPESDKVHLDSLVKNSLKAPKMVDDPQKVTHFYGIPKQDLAGMSEADVMRYSPYVTEGTYNKMVERWSGARQKEDDAKFTFGEADEKSIWNAVQKTSVGGITGNDKRDSISKHKDKSDAYQAFRTEAMSALEARFQDKKKNVDPKEREQVINDLAIDKVIHQDSASFLTRHGLKATAGVPLGPGWGVLGAGAYGVGRALDWYRAPSIPADERKSITSLMRDLNGSEPSDEKINRYKRAKMLGASDIELHKIVTESE